MAQRETLTSLNTKSKPHKISPKPKTLIENPCQKPDRDFLVFKTGMGAMTDNPFKTRSFA